MNNYILAIGIDKYLHCKELYNAVNDINGILNVCTEKYEFDKKNIVLLENENATLENIINELESKFINLGPSDNLLILFCGHGEYDEGLSMGYLIPYDGNRYSKSTLLPYSTLFNYIKALKSHHVLLISDSCYSGFVFTQTRGLVTSVDDLDKISSKWAITSGRVETVSDGSPGENSPFSEALIRILSNNEKEVLNVSELSNRILSELAGKVPQTPRGEPLQMFGHKGGQFMFRRKNISRIGNNIQNKSNINSIHRDGLRPEIKDLVKTHYEIQNKIEEAENLNRSGTLRALERDFTSLKNVLNKELIKEFEIKKNDFQIYDILPKEYMEKIEELRQIKNEKNNAVKKQLYDRAIVLRDKEKILLKDLEKSKTTNSINSKIEFSSDSLFKDYLSLQTIMSIDYSNKTIIEDKICELLFLDISFNEGFISKHFYIDEREKTTKVLKGMI